MGTDGALTKDNPVRSERDGTIAAERLAGKTYRELSEQFGISKSTVFRILHDDEIRDVIETGTKEIVRLVPRAVNNYEQLLSSQDEKIKLQASKDCLQMTGIAPSHTQSTVMINILNQQIVPARSAELSAIEAFLNATQWQTDAIDVTPDNETGVNH